MNKSYRWWSFAEFVIGGAIVIAHNVYHVVPNEVPILFVLAFLSLRLRDGRWGFVGLSRPNASWRRIILIALAAAALRVLLGALVIDPITAHFWPPSIGPKGFHSIAGNLTVALRWFALIWTFAAFGEEIGYRGYLLNRFADLGAGSKTATWLAVVASAVLFGFGHFYKGPSGILDSGVAGLILGIAYVISGRNLWVCILAHGFIDTFGVVFTYLGLNN
jgi:membrane protease YdiL (CAAX protease family)